MGTIVFLIILAIVIYIATVRVIPKQECFVIERFGKFHKIVNSGLFFLMPLIDRVAYRHTLKEISFHLPSQVCITHDSIKLTVNSCIYIQVSDPKLASYSTKDYIVALTELAQTTLHTVIANMELETTLKQRDEINKSMLAALEKTTLYWGIKVLDYLVLNLILPEEILQTLEAQLTKEREKPV